MDDFNKLYNSAFIVNKKGEKKYLFDNTMCKIDVIEDIFTIKDKNSEMECHVKLSSEFYLQFRYRRREKVQPFKNE
ncbi:hypothetical protein [Brachyspira suanatina]|nr:hypothetical protein [Brachyspira suanatina]